MKKLDITLNPLYGGKPKIAKRDGKYHVIQGNFTADCVREWYDTKEIAVKRWNDRTYCLLHNMKDRYC